MTQFELLKPICEVSVVFLLLNLRNNSLWWLLAYSWSLIREHAFNPLPYRILITKHRLILQLLLWSLNYLLWLLKFNFSLFILSWESSALNLLGICLLTSFWLYKGFKIFNYLHFITSSNLGIRGTHSFTAEIFVWWRDHFWHIH